MVFILILALPADNPWTALGFPTNALIVGLLLEFTRDLIAKVGFVLMSLLAFVSNAKLRTNLPLTIVIIVGSFTLSPLVLGVVLLSSIFLTPLLPLFTLPVFAVSFPRPQRFWPSLVDYGSTYLKTTEETVYYKHAESEMAKAVYGSISCGAAPSQPGTQLLLRFDNKLALVSILESGYGYCTINTRGMELQETSCHSEEATRIDDMFEGLHNPTSRKQSLFNTMPLSTLTPVDSVVIQTYSDAHNVLTGIIDQPGSLQQFSSNLIKILVWVFNRHVKSTVVAKGLGSQISEGAESTEKAERDSIDEILDMETSQRQRRFSMVARKEDRSKSLFTTYLGDETGSVSSSGVVSTHPVELPPLRYTPERERWLDPFPDISEENSSAERDGSHTAAWHQQQRDPVLPPLHPEKISVNSNKVAPEDSPRTWAHPPLTHLQIFRLMQHFPHEWHSYILNNGKAMESEMFELLSKIVVGCFGLLDVPAHGTLTHNASPVTHPQDIYRRFCGSIPYSPHRTWMMEHPVMWKLALKAYRYNYYAFIHPDQTESSFWSYLQVCCEADV